MKNLIKTICTLLLIALAIATTFELSGMNNALRANLAEAETKEEMIWQVKFIDLCEKIYNEGHKGKITTEHYELEVNMLIQANPDWVFIGFERGCVAMFEYKTPRFNGDPLFGSKRRF